MIFVLQPLSLQSCMKMMFLKMLCDNFSHCVPVSHRQPAKGITGPRDALQFIVENKLQSMMPDVVTCYMLFLTLPVTVASCERSFSKLRMVKNYLRSSCGQDRLSGLALLSIESKVARSLNLDDLIKNFASMKVRRKKVVN